MITLTIIVSGFAILLIMRSFDSPDHSAIYKKAAGRIRANRDVRNIF